MRAWVAAALVVSALVAGACDDDAAIPARSSEGPLPEGRRYASLDEVGDALGCQVEDVGTGGNAGLAAFGVCHVAGDNVDVYLTSDRGLWEHLAEQFPSVLGPNWIIVCPTGAEAARRVHARLGGTLEIPAT